MTSFIGVVAAAAVLLPPAPAMAAGAQVDQPVPMAFVINGDIWLATGLETVRVTQHGNNSWPRISPDHHEIAYVHEGNIWVATIFGTTPPSFVSQQITFGNNANGPSWSPDGSFLAYRTGDVQFGMLVLLRLHSPGLAVRTILGERLAAAPAREPQTVTRFPQPTRTGTAAFSPLRLVNAVAWSPDGRSIAFPGGDCFAIYDDCLTVLDLATNAERAVAVFGGGGVPSGFATTPAWSSDSGRLFWTQQKSTADQVGPLQVIGHGLNTGRTWRVGRNGDHTPVFIANNTFLVSAPLNGTTWIAFLTPGNPRLFLIGGDQADWNG